MPVELRRGAFTALCDMLAAEGVARAGKLVTALIGVTAAQARINVSTGSHAYGTPTPASPGAGPARISGTLRDSITTVPAVFRLGTWTGIVTVIPGRYPPYGVPKTHRKASAKPRADSRQYGYYLEHSDWGYVYPWLIPALDWTATGPFRILPPEIFGAPWPVYG